jgi:hypothetical protein
VNSAHATWPWGSKASSLSSKTDVSRAATRYAGIASSYAYSAAIIARIYAISAVSPGGGAAAIVLARFWVVVVGFSSSPSSKDSSLPKELSSVAKVLCSGRGGSMVEGFGAPMFWAPGVSVCCARFRVFGAICGFYVL